MKLAVRHSSIVIIHLTILAAVLSLGAANPDDNLVDRTTELKKEVAELKLELDKVQQFCRLFRVNTYRECFENNDYKHPQELNEVFEKYARENKLEEKDGRTARYPVHGPVKTSGHARSKKCPDGNCPGGIVVIEYKPFYQIEQEK